MSKFVCMGLGALLLCGCSVFSSEEDVIKMAELPVFEASYQPKIDWEHSVGSGVDKYYSQLQPVADEKFVYVASRAGQVKAFAAQSGKLLWSVNFAKHESNKLNRSARFSGGISLAGRYVIDWHRKCASFCFR